MDLAAHGTDPVEQRKVAKREARARKTFAEVLGEWFTAMIASDQARSKKPWPVTPSSATSSSSCSTGG
jgi:hypothetical protein